MIVILHVTEQRDSLSHVQLMLIEAFCNENDIRLLQVKGTDELWNAVTPENYVTENEDDEDDDAEDEIDISLMVIQVR